MRVTVPPELQPHLPPPHTGKANLTKALGTDNEREANRLAVPWIAEFQAAITAAARVQQNPNLHDWIARYAYHHPGGNPFPRSSEFERIQLHADVFPACVPRCRAIPPILRPRNESLANWIIVHIFQLLIEDRW